jgi:adenine-specific DNA methylase
MAYGRNLRLGPVVSTATIGWRRGCTCEASRPVPQTVLDPFAGAGTTALVAEWLGRSSVLIELNPDYAAVALERLGRRADAAQTA